MVLGVKRPIVNFQFLDNSSNILTPIVLKILLRVCLCVDQGALKITLLVQHLGARWRASAIARLKSEPLPIVLSFDVRYIYGITKTAKDLGKHLIHLMYHFKDDHKELFLFPNTASNTLPHLKYEKYNKIINCIKSREGRTDFL